MHRLAKILACSSSSSSMTINGRFWSLLSVKFDRVYENPLSSEIELSSGSLNSLWAWAKWNKKGVGIGLHKKSVNGSLQRKIRCKSIVLPERVYFICPAKQRDHTKRPCLVVYSITDTPAKLQPTFQYHGETPPANSYASMVGQPHTIS